MEKLYHLSLRLSTAILYII